MRSKRGVGRAFEEQQASGIEEKWHGVIDVLLQERRRWLQPPPAACHVQPDRLDEAGEREEEAVWLAVLDRSRDVQVIVEEALRRLAAGVYGRCVECGSHIAKARLSALPFAVRCLSCQERFERQTEVSARPRRWWREPSDE